MEELRDIKGLVEVPDTSFYYFLGLLGLVTIIVMIVAVLIYKQVMKKEAMTQQKLAIKELGNFEFGDAKESAYHFSHLAQYAVDKEQTQKLQEILEALEVYKYQKEVPELDSTLKAKMQSFIEEVRGG